MYSNSNSESDTRKSIDCSRDELLWERREERLLYRWLEEIKRLSQLHKIHARYYKRLYNITAMPATFTPLIGAGLSSVIATVPMLGTTLMLGTGCLSAINTFMNFGKRFQQHFEYENKYASLAKEIEMELSKPKGFRMACDVYLQKVMMHLNHLNEMAPDVKSPVHKTKKLSDIQMEKIKE